MAKKIFVLAPTHSQPRFHKRVEQLAKFGDLVIFYFSRNLYNQNHFDERHRQVNLGLVEDRKYYKRISSLINAYFLIKKHANKIKPDIVYSFSIDFSVIALLVGFKRGYLEIGDLILPNGLGRLSRIIEYYLFVRMQKIVLTSGAFVDNYSKWHCKKLNKFITIENKMSSYFSISARGEAKRINYPVVIGLVGLLRYELPIKRLINFVKNSENVKLVCFGDGLVKDYIIENSSSKISYMGSFKNPDDLESIYNSIDINYVVYDNSFSNVRAALPNKLYESMFWCKPIVVAEDTFLAQKVKKFNIGGEIPIGDQVVFNNLMTKFCEPKWIEQKARTCCRIPTVDLIDNSIDELGKILKN